MSEGDRPLRVAVVGTGSMGRNHVRVYGALKEARVVAVVDPRRARAREAAATVGATAYADLREMLRREEVEAASVAVPTVLHRPVAVELLEAGVHVLVEKPLAPAVADGEAIVRAARRAGRTLLVGHVERFNPAIRKLEEILREGRLGSLSSLVSKRVGFFPERITDMNVIVDLASHDIDLFNHLLGRPPDSVYARAGKAVAGRDHEDYASIFLGYGSANAMIEVNWITPLKIRRLEATGTGGYAEVNYITQSVTLYPRLSIERLRKGADAFAASQSIPATPLRVPVRRQEPLMLELRHFLRCARGLEAPAMHPKEALLVLRVLRDVIRSYQAEGPKAVVRRRTPSGRVPA